MIADAALPLDDGAFAQLMAPFEPFEASPALAVAVSGGRDSLSLALLAHDWVQARGGRVIGLIVDHGLRPESSDEAEATKTLLARHGIEAAILTWTGAKPQTGLQEAARAERYRLLREECRRHGILHLLLAHHADDQAETVAMRAVRRSGPDGLAGMAALVEQPELRLLRPLLGVPRARLTATLVARGVRWLDDPSNIDLRFERVRLRMGPQQAATAAAAAGGRAAREQALARAAVEVLEFDQVDGVCIDQAGFERLTADLQTSLLSRIIQAMGGRDHPPRRDRLERAVRRLCSDRGLPDRGKSGRGQDFTLSGCKLMLRQAPQRDRQRWIVRPERGRNDGRNESQPLVPAAFFACGAPAASHLE